MLDNAAQQVIFTNFFFFFSSEGLNFIFSTLLSSRIV